MADCSNCGLQLEDDSLICFRCGQRRPVSVSSEPPRESPPGMENPLESPLEVVQLAHQDPIMSFIKWAGIVAEATDLKVSLQVSFTERVVLLPNAKKMLQTLKENGFRLALATMAARDVVDKVTKYHGIDEYFDHILTADDVERVKPDPEVLTKTVELFGGQVNSSLYIGDSTHDLEAAVSLAMPFLLVDSGIFVRGETRTQLRISAEENGFPIVDREGLLDICEIAKNHHF